jgi:hypothetical protein
MHLPNASHSKINLLVNLGSVRTRVVHIDYFKVWKDWSATGVQLKALFLRRFVRGATIFHNYEQTCDNIPLNLGNHTNFKSFKMRHQFYTASIFLGSTLTPSFPTI